MFDCADDVVAHHDDDVTLPKDEQDEMRERRDINRDRLKKGLEKDEKPAPREFKSQGSYDMHTMTQHEERNYDVDDGVYFEKSKLIGGRGAEMSALDVRQMVRDALDDGSFNTPPKMHTNCVRVQYNAGYQVDVPIYRRVIVSGEGTKNEEVICELASADWKRSDARDVSKWYSDENIEQSPDTTNGRQLRRITRDVKKFAKSRSSWEELILGGFGISTLIVECYRKNADREDMALYDTMKAIRDRLDNNLAVKHPVTPEEYITKETDDAKARFLRDKLSDALGWLEPLFEHDCDREQALRCWDKVFATTYFIERLDDDEDESKGASAISSSAFQSVVLAKTKPDVVRKEGGGRFA
jgi:hypothetical protein